jgi:sugar transferase EpsL
VTGHLYCRFGKRAFDLAAATAAIILLSPLILVSAVIVRVWLGNPIFFRQVRPGWNEQPFTLIKLRSMRDVRDTAGNQLSDGERLTPLGRFLRRSSLDELPELWNVLRGEMSLVGPRPLLTKYAPHYTEHERRRFAVRPGMTGLAQVRGRNELSWDERLAYDVTYVERCSFALDLRILLSTLWQAALGRNVHADSRSRREDLDVERLQRRLGSSPELRIDA